MHLFIYFFVLCSSNFFALGIQTVPKFKCPLLTFVRWAEVWKAARGAVCPGQMSCGSGMLDCIWNLQIPVWDLLRLLGVWNILLTTAAPFSSQFARLSDSMDRWLWTEGKAKETTLIVLELEWTVGPQIYTSGESSVFWLAKQSLAWSRGNSTWWLWSWIVSSLLILLIFFFPTPIKLRHVAQE